MKGIEILNLIDMLRKLDIEKNIAQILFYKG